jgi:hypothetical protein
MAKNEQFTSPAGTAVYPYLTRADFEYEPEGVFKTKLRMSEADASDLIKTIGEVANTEFGAKAKTARMPFTKVEDTGEVEFLIKSRFKPKVVDSKGKLIPEDEVPAIFGGSRLRVAGTIAPYNRSGNTGVSLRLAGVQIVELSEGSGSAGMNFGAVEGGFVAANDNAEETEAAYNF